MQPVDHKVEWR
jgi:hypothetical protein